MSIAVAGRQESEVADLDGRTPLELAHGCGGYAVVDYPQSTYGLSPWSRR